MIAIPSIIDRVARSHRVRSRFPGAGAVTAGVATCSRFVAMWLPAPCSGLAIKTLAPAPGFCRVHDFTSLNQTACQEEPQQVSGIAATGNVEVKGSERSCSVQKTEQNPTGRLSGNRASVEHARPVRTRGAVTVKDPVNKQVTDCPDKGHRHHGQSIVEHRGRLPITSVASVSELDSPVSFATTKPCGGVRDASVL